MVIFNEIDLETFKKEYWCKSSVNLTYNLDLLKDLFSLSDLDALVHNSLKPDIELEIWKDGKRIPPQLYRSPNLEYSIDADLAISLYKKGSTLVFNHLHLRIFELSKVTRHLEILLNAQGHANVYVTPPNAQGFPLHKDGHCVFVVQIYGTKSWKVGPPNSVNESDFVSCILKPGDILYIPKDWPHEARTTDSSSVHITVGMASITLKELIKSVIECSSILDNTLNEPVQIFDTPNEKLIERVVAKMKSVSTAFAFEGIRQIRSTFIRAREPIIKGHFIESILALDSSRFEGKIRFRDTIMCFLSEDQDELILEFHRRVIRMPKECSIFMVQLVSGKSVDVNVIAEVIGKENTKIIIKQLYDEGLIIDEKYQYE